MKEKKNVPDLESLTKKVKVLIVLYFFHKNYVLTLSIFLESLKIEEMI